MTVEQEDDLKGIPEHLWSQGPGDVGLIKGVTPVQVVPKSDYRPYQKQYPLKPEAIKGITPSFEQLREGGREVLSCRGMKHSVTRLFFQ